MIIITIISSMRVNHFGEPRKNGKIERLLFQYFTIFIFQYNKSYYELMSGLTTYL